MGKKSPTIFLSAAEASGDLHAARLMEALRQRRPDARFLGVGGPEMFRAGCVPAVEGLSDLTQNASMLCGPILRLGYYVRAVKQIQKAIRRIRPDIHVPVDSPALNWHLARAAKNAGAKVVYYVAPQLWAWAPWRVKKLRRLTDRVACILPFEERWLQQYGVSARYVGHPLFDSLPPQPQRPPNIIQAWGNGNWNVALLAGSRSGEIHKHTHALAEVAKAVRRRWPNAAFTFAAGDTLSAEALQVALPGDASCEVTTDGEPLFTPGKMKIVAERTNEVLAAAHFAVTVSGTITLQIAHFGLPMVVFYKVGRLAYSLIGRWLLRTPHLSLVNILAGRRIVPELMPWHGRNRPLADMVLDVMDDLGYLVETRQELLGLAESLRPTPPQTASGNAADLILDVLDNRC